MKAKEASSVRLVGLELDANHMESSKQSAQKIKNRTTVCSGRIPLVLWEEKESTSRYMHTSVHHSTSPSSQDMETARLFGRTTYKETLVYTYKGSMIQPQREGSSHRVTWMNFKGMMLRNSVCQR